MSDRQPTQDDADEYGCVIIWHLFQGVMVTGWRNAANGIYHTHWMRTPAKPDNAEAMHKDFEDKIMKQRF